MPLSDENFHLKSDEHRNKTKQQLVWCEDCGKYTSDKTSHFQSEINFPKSRHSKAGFAYTSQMNQLGQDVEKINNEKTYIKLKINPTDTQYGNFEKQVNEV